MEHLLFGGSALHLSHHFSWLWMDACICVCASCSQWCNKYTRFKFSVEDGKKNSTQQWYIMSYFNFVHQHFKSGSAPMLVVRNIWREKKNVKPPLNLNIMAFLCVSTYTHKMCQSARFQKFTKISSDATKHVAPFQFSTVH